MTAAVHLPVMVEEVTALLRPDRGGTFVDCTVGLGGHARALLERGADRLVGIDRDPHAIVEAGARLTRWADRVTLVHADYRQLAQLPAAAAPVRGMVADLGVSSMQLDAPGRGFSFRRDDPLDMRMDTTSPVTAADLVAELDETTLANVIFEYGEERFSRRIGRAIVAARQGAPITTTGQLAAIVRRAVGGRRGSRIDPATRTFQALRIRVNDELTGLGTFLADAAAHLEPGGRLAIISFHSLEDRIVKQTFRALAAGEPRRFVILTKRPLTPAATECEQNPRARSAKLRALERQGDGDRAVAGDGERTTGKGPRDREEG